MNSNRKIAILVHNDVIKDARVRKQARTLTAKGYSVDIFGFSTNIEYKYPESLEGAILKIDTEKTATVPAKIYLKLARTAKSAASIYKKHPLPYSLCLLTIGATLAQVALSLTLIQILIAGSCITGIFIILRHLLNKKIKDIKQKLGYQSIAKTLSKNVIGKQYFAVHCNDIIALIAGGLIKDQQPQTRIIWDAHELYTELSYKSPTMKDQIHQIIKNHSDKVDQFITISESFSKIYAERYPKLPEAKVVMNATRRPDSLHLKTELIRSSTQIEDDQKIILFQGGFSRDRGIEKLLESALQLPEDWSIVFMGYGILEKSIVEFASKHNSKRPKTRPYVATLPAAPQEELRHWTSGATIGIIPYENSSLNHLYCTPNKLWEYPNARIPIIATNLIETSNFINRHQVGILLPRDFTPEDIAKAIKNLSTEQIEKWKISCDNLNEIENWEKYEIDLLSAYE